MKRHNEKHRTLIRRRISLFLAITFVTSTQGPILVGLAAPQMFFRPSGGVSRSPLQVDAFDAPGFGEVSDAINLATGNVYVAMDGASKNNLLEANTVAGGNIKKDEVGSNMQAGWNLDARLRLDGFSKTMINVPQGFFLGSGDGSGTDFGLVTMNSAAFLLAPSWIKRYQTMSVADQAATSFYALNKKPGEQFSSEWVVLRKRGTTVPTLNYTNSFLTPLQVLISGTSKNFNSGNIAVAAPATIAVNSSFDTDLLLDGFTSALGNGWLSGKIGATNNQKISPAISGRVPDGAAAISVTVGLEDVNRLAYPSTAVTCVFSNTPSTCQLPQWTKPADNKDVYLAVSGLATGKTVYLGGQKSFTEVAGSISGAAIAHYYAHDGTRTTFFNDADFADYSQTLHQQLRGVKLNGDPEGEKAACGADQVVATCTPKTEFTYDAANPGRLTKVKDQWGRVSTYEWDTGGKLLNINYLLRSDTGNPVTDNASYSRRAAFAYSPNDKNGLSLGGPQVVSSVTYSTRSGKADGTGAGIGGSNGKEKIIVREFRFSYEKIGTNIVVSRIQRPAIGVTGGFLNTDYSYYNSAAVGSTDSPSLDGKIKKVSQTNAGLDDITYFYVIGGSSADGITNTYGGIMYLVKQGNNTTGKRTAYLFDGDKQLRERRVRDYSKRYDVTGAVGNATPTATDFSRDLSTKYEYYNAGDGAISNTFTLVNSALQEKVDITPSTGNFFSNGLVVANPAQISGITAGFDPNNTLEGFTSTASGGSLGTKLNAVTGKTISPSIALQVTSGTATVYLGIQDLNGVHQVPQKVCTVTTVVSKCEMVAYAVPNTGTQLKFGISWGGAQTIYMGGQNSKAFVAGGTPNDPTGSTKAVTDPAGKRVLFSYDQYGNVASQKTFASPIATTAIREENWVYDSDNQATSHTVAAQSGATSDGVTYSYPPVPDTTNYTYHSVNAGDGQTFRALQTSTYLPTLAGRVGSVLTFDDQGRLISSSVQRSTAVPPILRTTTYSYKIGGLDSAFLMTADGQSSGTSMADPVRQYRDLIHQASTTGGATQEFTYDAYGNINMVRSIGALRTVNAGGVMVDADQNNYSYQNGFGQTVGEATVSMEGYSSIRGWNYADSGEFANSWEGTNENVTQYSYDAKARLNQMVHGVGASGLVTSGLAHETMTIPATGGYDVFNRVISRDQDGFTTTIEYDTLDRITHLNRPDGTKLDTAYDPSGLKSLECQSVGPVNTNSLTAPDTRRCQINVVDGLGRITTSTDWTAENAYDIKFEYDNFDRVIRQENAALSEINNAGADQATYFAYSAYGQLLKQLDPVMRSKPFSPSTSSGVGAAISDSRRPYTQLKYDDWGRPVFKAVLHQGPVSLTSFPTKDLLSATTCPTPYATLAADAAAITCTTYDALDRVATLKDADGYLTTLYYDLLGHVTSQVRQVWKTSELAYAETNAGFTSVTTQLAYNAAGKVIATTDPRGYTKAVKYDTLGNVLAEKDERNITTKTYQYSKDGLLERMAEPDTKDLNTSSSWAFFSGTTAPTGYVVTKLETYVNRVFPSQQCEAFMDAPASTGNLKCTTFVSRDYAGRVNDTQLPDNKHITQSYDLNGNQISMTDADGFKTEYAFDARSRLRTQLQKARATGTTADDLAFPVATRGTWTGLTSSYSYDAAGNLKKKTERGLSTEYVYNSMGKVMVEAKAHDATNITVDKSSGYRLDGELLAESSYGADQAYFTDPTLFSGTAAAIPVNGNISGYRLSPGGKRVVEWSVGKGSDGVGKAEKTVSNTYDGLGFRHYRDFSGHADIYDAPVSTGGSSYRTFWTSDANGNLTGKWDMSSNGADTTKYNVFNYTYSASNKEVDQWRDVSVKEYLPNSQVIEITASRGTVDATNKIAHTDYNERDLVTSTNTADSGNALGKNVTTTYTYFHDGSTQSVASDGLSKDMQYDARGRQTLVTAPIVPSTGGFRPTITTGYLPDGVIVTTALQSSNPNAPLYQVVTSPTIGGQTGQITTSTISPIVTGSPILWTKSGCFEYVEYSAHCYKHTENTFNADGQLVSSSTNNEFKYRLNNSGDWGTSTYRTTTTPGYDAFYNRSSESKKLEYVITDVRSPAINNVGSNITTYSASYDANNAIISETLTPITPSVAEPSTTAPGFYTNTAIATGSPSVRNFTLDSRGNRTGMGATTDYIFSNSKKRYDADTLVSSFDRASITDASAYNVDTKGRSANFVVFRYDPRGQQVLSANFLLQVRGNYTLAGNWASGLKGHSYSSVSTEGGIRLMVDRQACSYSGQVTWFTLSDCTNPTDSSSLNKIEKSRTDTYTMYDSITGQSDSSVFDVIQSFGVGEVTSTPLEAPTTALSTSTRVEPTTIEAPGSSTPSTDSPSSSIEAPSKDQPVTAKDQPSSSAPTFSSGANLNANALSPTVSTPAFGVTSFTINPNTLTPIASGSNAPSTNAESTPGFTTEFSLEAPVSVLPPAISSFSVTSIVNPLENIGFIPNLGSVSDIAAPGITAPGTVSTPSSGAGGITAPTDSSAGVPELPRIESPNGNVSSVVAPVGTGDAGIKALAFLRDASGNCYYSIDLNPLFGLPAVKDQCTQADLDAQNQKKLLDQKMATGDYKGAASAAEAYAQTLAGIQDGKGKGGNRSAQKELNDFLNSDWYKKSDPQAQLQVLQAISQGLQLGTIGGEALRGLNQIASVLTSNCAIESGKLMCQISKWNSSSNSGGTSSLQWARDGLSIAIGFTPVGDVLGVYSAISGFDPIAGRKVEGFDRWIGLLGLIGLGGKIRSLAKAGRLAAHGAEELRAIDNVIAGGRSLASSCLHSFALDTKVLTRAGLVAIATLAVGSKVMAFNETTNKQGEFEITAVHKNTDPQITKLQLETINRDDAKSYGSVFQKLSSSIKAWTGQVKQNKLETITTTPEHPFYLEKAGNAQRPKPQGHEDLSGYWVGAGHLLEGDVVKRADGGFGVVKSVTTLEQSRVMYNLTVDGAHTFFVGDGQWLVHNADSCPKIVFEAMLKRGVDYPGVPRRLHFSESNRQLYESMKANPEFESWVKVNYPDVFDHVQPNSVGNFRQTSPPDFTWHHDANTPGNMQLIPYDEHSKTFWSFLHPGNKGGFANWGK